MTKLQQMTLEVYQTNTGRCAPRGAKNTLF